MQWFLGFFAFLADALTGLGLFGLVALSHTSPHASNFTLVLYVSLLIILLIHLALVSVPLAPPPWATLFNTTVCLILSVSVFFNAVAQISPTYARDVSVIPVYALLCSARLRPSRRGFAVLGALSLLAVALLLLTPASKSARPSSTDALDWWQILELFVCLFVSCNFRFSGVLQSLFPSVPGVQCPRETQWTGVALRAAVLGAVGLMDRSCLMHLLQPRSQPVPRYLTVVLCTLLLFSCMQTAAVWYKALQDLVWASTKDGFAPKKLVRLKHVLHVIVVAIALLFPFQRRVVLAGVGAAVVAVNLIP
jgi:hypothetical protein